MFAFIHQCLYVFFWLDDTAIGIVSMLISWCTCTIDIKHQLSKFEYTSFWILSCSYYFSFVLRWDRHLSSPTVGVAESEISLPAVKIAGLPALTSFNSFRWVVILGRSAVCISRNKSVMLHTQCNWYTCIFLQTLSFANIEIWFPSQLLAEDSESRISMWLFTRAKSCGDRILTNTKYSRFRSVATSTVADDALVAFFI